MKRILYIALFGFLGLLVSTLLHAALELPALWIITGNLEVYGDSFVWRNWHIVHGWGGIIIWLLGGFIGTLLGIKYWKIMYQGINTKQKQN